MADKSKIEWCDATWNPVTGCSPVSAGCDNCYAAAMAKRFPQIVGGDFRPRLHSDRLGQPLHWKKPRKVFVCSMGDLFHEQFYDHTIDRVFRVMQRCDHHTYLLLTKRAERLTCLDWRRELYRLANVWLGVTCENQAAAEERVQDLLHCPAALRWVSAEPLLGPIDLEHVPMRAGGLYVNGVNALAGYEYESAPGLAKSERSQKIDWLVVGCETGPNRRPCKLEWVESLIDQCNKSQVPVFVKKLEINGTVTNDMRKFPVWAQRRGWPNPESEVER